MMKQTLQDLWRLGLSKGLSNIAKVRVKGGGPEKGVRCRWRPEVGESMERGVGPGRPLLSGNGIFAVF